MRIRDVGARRGVLFRRFASALCAAAIVGFAAASVPMVAQGTDTDAVTVQAHAVTPHLVAYGQVEPISVVPVSAAETGVVEGLRAVPGAHVRAGQELARLSGPAMRTLLMQDEADVRSASSQLDAAQKTLAIDRGQLPSHLSTRQMVHQAESAEAQAQAALDNAQARLNAARQMITVVAPASGTVLAINSSNGELVSAGQAVVTLQPEGGLWLRAAYYGAALNSIHLGMTGRFTPSGGGALMAVRVCSAPAMLAAGGGESIALCPEQHAAWLNGEAGTVTLDLPQRKLVAVPTRALVLNQGKWWVMVHTAKGDRPQQVVPGPAEGWETFLESGVAPGTSVIVNNAYLLFHANLAEQFQIPD
ncbi:MAG TPA: HlyD family efflux transporter periplasmic adaptor subunit [Terracidiphilus sp.]|nr:HlyD family efflux transporter periplasmic adaptor subunit [Terracidiphilus sp.]